MHNIEVDTIRKAIQSEMFIYVCQDDSTTINF